MSSIRRSRTTHRSSLSKSLLLTTLVPSISASTLRGRSHADTFSTKEITHLMKLSTSSTSSKQTALPSTLSNPESPSLVETQESLVHVLQRALGGTSASASVSADPKKPAIDPVAVSMGQTITASMAYGQPIAHPVNSAWNPLNQDHTPQAATNQVVQQPYDASLINPGAYDSTTLNNMNNAGYSAYPNVDGVLSLVEQKENNKKVTSTDAPGIMETTPMKTSEEYADQVLGAPRGQPVTNPSIMAGVSVVQHPALANVQ